ncbi:hypothetical protein [Deinococcus humi]|uniref:Uncharacterized protein n=1 Tax=Deinococcus humi TaxID=662880 RepID=A0A7W8NEN5_9DEIO|nr:hypothetical protein [Deinococcus humi]MBB5361948.1 hypothetical protein [Deinococcus humi]GGO22847.1 hypothetical protein GCM10008949_10470 [Deinococcus humi]
MSRFKTTSIKTIFHKTPLIALAALPLTVGAVLAQQSAATDATTQAQQPQRVQPTQPGQRNQGGTGTQTAPGVQSGTNYADVYLQKLAAGLGISLDRLKAAALAAGNATIDQGVKNGDIAANRATDMKTRLKDNPFGMLGGRGMGGPGGPGGRGMHGPGGRGGGPRGAMDVPDGTQGQTDSGPVDPNAVDGGS